MKNLTIMKVKPFGKVQGVIIKEGGDFFAVDGIPYTRLIDWYYNAKTKLWRLTFSKGVVIEGVTISDELLVQFPDIEFHKLHMELFEMPFIEINFYRDTTVNEVPTSDMPTKANFRFEWIPEEITTEWYEGRINDEIPVIPMTMHISEKLESIKNAFQLLNEGYILVKKGSSYYVGTFVEFGKFIIAEYKRGGKWKEIYDGFVGTKVSNYVPENQGVRLAEAAEKRKERE